MKKFLLATCFALLSGPAFAVVFDFTSLSVPSGTFRATGLNDVGLFTGTYLDGTAEGQFQTNAATYANGIATRINVPFNGFNSYTNLFGLNDAGLLVGAAGSRFGGGFAYQNGQVLDSGIPVGLNSIAYDVNNIGQIVGSLYAFTGQADRGAFVAGGVTTLFDVPGAYSTVATGLNDAADIVGYYQAMGARVVNGFLLSGGLITTIDVPGSMDTRPRAINNAGTVVGTYRNGSTQHGFLLQGGAYTDITDASGTAFLPAGLNNAGQIVGMFEGEQLSFVGTPQAAAQSVTEPSSVMIVSICIAFLGVVHQRRQQRS